jgi:hypothetical protein
MPRFDRSVRLLLLASWSCVGASIAHAQSDSVSGHHGPQVALSIGAGLKPGPCAACVGWGEPVVAPALMLRVGWGVSPRTVLSADFSAWGRTLDGTGEFTTWQMITAQFYPDPRGGLYFNAGIGRAVDATDVRTTREFATVSTHTLGLSAGIGYDQRASYSFSPSLDVLYAVPQWTGDSYTGPVRAGSTVIRLGFTSVWRHAGTQTEDDSGHHGFHAAFELGMGTTLGTCGGCSGLDASASGPLVMLRLGGAVSPRVVVSGEFDAWSGDKSGADDSTMWEMLIVQYYPSMRKGFYVSAGMGLATDEFSGRPEGIDPGFANNTDVAHALGLDAGVGYDLHVSESFSLTPSIDMLHAMPQRSANGTRLGPTMIRAGVAFAWR